MKNETIKIYNKVASESEVLRLSENGEKLAFNQDGIGNYTTGILIAIKINKTCPYETLDDGHFEHCYTVTELDPCQSPDGCLELEPWMAYVGSDHSIRPTFSSFGSFWLEDADGWIDYRNHGSTFNGARAVDVRTAWTQGEYPEHCRIRAYEEPCAMDVAWNAHSNGGAYTFPREEHFRAGWKAAMSHAITNRKEILKSL